MTYIIGNFLIWLGIVIVGLGVFGIYRFKHFYTRALVASKIDTVGYITLLFGIILRKGLCFFSLKVLLIVIITIIINPLVTHAIVRSAYMTGYKVGKE